MLGFRAFIPQVDVAIDEAVLTFMGEQTNIVELLMRLAHAWTLLMWAVGIIVGTVVESGICMAAQERQRWLGLHGLVELGIDGGLCKSVRRVHRTAVGHCVAVHVWGGEM